MNETWKCPECGAELPAGSPDAPCPACLMKLGLESWNEREKAYFASEGPFSETPPISYEPPKPEELADRFGQFEILELLGYGGMGAVYKVRQKSLDRLVALKIIRPGTAHDRGFAERFSREAKALARLSHPSIVTVYDFGESDGLYYLVMEYVDGANLRQTMQAGPLEPGETLQIVPQVCDALQYAHDEGIVHRDIKPENILLDKNGRVKIADFGLAKLVGGDTTDPTLTGTRQVMGTIRYMAPEQMASSHRVDHRADIYSLGVVFYEMLTGETPIGHFDPPSKKVRIDVRLDEVVLRALASEPERRFQQASELKSNVEQITLHPQAEFPEPRDNLSSRQAAGISTIFEREAQNLRRWFSAEPHHTTRQPPTTPSVLMIVLSIAGCLLLLLPWMDLEIDQDTLVRGAAVRLENPVARTFAGSDRKPGITTAALFGCLALLLLITPSTQRPTIPRSVVMTAMAGLALLHTLLFRGDLESGSFPVSITSESYTSDTPPRLTEIDHRITYREGFYGSLGLSLVLLVLSATGVRHATVWRAEVKRGRKQVDAAAPVSVRNTATGDDAVAIDNDLSASEPSGVPPEIKPKQRQVEHARGFQLVRSLLAPLLIGLTAILLLTSCAGVFIYLLRSIPTRTDSTNVANIDRSADEHVAAGVQNQTRRAEQLSYANHIERTKEHWDNGNVKEAWFSLEACHWEFRGWEHDYLYTLLTGNQVTFTGHTGRVRSVAFSPDGRQIVSGSDDGTLKIWNTSTGQRILTLQGHPQVVTSVAFRPDGKQVVSASEDQTLKVWDVSNGQEMLTLTGHAGIVSSVAFSPNGQRIVSGSSDATLGVWSVSTDQRLFTLEGHAQDVTCLAFSPDGTRIVSGSEDRTLKVWDATGGQEMLTMTGHAMNVSGVAFSPDGERIVSGSADKTLKVWDASSGQDLLTFLGHAESVTSVAYSPDGRQIVSASQDRKLKVWDASSGEETLTLIGHSGPVWDVDFSPDGKKLLSGSGRLGEPGEIKIWDPSARQKTLTLKGHAGEVNNVVFSPDGTKILSGSDDKALKVWDASNGQLMLTLTGHTEPVSGLAFSPDGRQIASGSRDGTLRIWDANSGRETHLIMGHDGFVRDLAFSPDGLLIVSGGGDNTLKLWGRSSGRELLEFNGHSGSITSVVFSPSGKQIVSASRDLTLKVWDASGGGAILTLKGHTAPVTSSAFSSDGTKIVSGSQDAQLKVWSATSGRELISLTGHERWVTDVAFSPDGRRIVSGGDDSTLRIWNASNGMEMLTLTGHEGPVWHVAFSPDGKKIASGDADGTIRIWDASRRQARPLPEE